jgi:hypothetical protein
MVKKNNELENKDIIQSLQKALDNKNYDYIKEIMSNEKNVLEVLKLSETGNGEIDNETVVVEEPLLTSALIITLFSLDTKNLDTDTDKYIKSFISGNYETIKNEMANFLNNNELDNRAMLNLYSNLEVQKVPFYSGSVLLNDSLSECQNLISEKHMKQYPVDNDRYDNLINNKSNFLAQELSSQYASCGTKAILDFLPENISLEAQYKIGKSLENNDLIKSGESTIFEKLISEVKLFIESFNMKKYEQKTELLFQNIERKAKSFTNMSEQIGVIKEEVARGAENDKLVTANIQKQKDSVQARLTERKEKKEAAALEKLNKKAQKRTEMTKEPANETDVQDAKNLVKQYQANINKDAQLIGTNIENQKSKIHNKLELRKEQAEKYNKEHGPKAPGKTPKEATKDQNIPGKGRV